MAKVCRGLLPQLHRSFGGHFIFFWVNPAQTFIVRCGVNVFVLVCITEDVCLLEFHKFF